MSEFTKGSAVLTTEKRKGGNPEIKRKKKALANIKVMCWRMYPGKEVCIHTLQSSDGERAS